ncbi:Negative regulator [Dirofilaria immitis]
MVWLCLRRHCFDRNFGLSKKANVKESSMMDKVTYELQEKVVVIIWDWVSVQVPLDKITLFISKIRSAVAENLNEYHPHECAFLVYCDARFTSIAITRELTKSSDIDIHHIESHESSWIICKKLHRIHVDYDPGVIALISGPSTAYGPILTKFSRCGWHVQLFHPENAPKDYIDYGDHNWPVERLLGSEIEDININVNFPHTVYFLVSELCNNDESLGFLSNVTEQYESNVIYFNEKATEAIVELKAFDVERVLYRTVSYHCDRIVRLDEEKR